MFADIIVWIIINNNLHLFVFNETIKLLKHYMDDFIGGHNKRVVAKRQYEMALYWFKVLGIPLQIRKWIAPTQLLTFIGYRLHLNCIYIYNIYNTKLAIGISKKRMKKYVTFVRKLMNQYKYKQRKLTIGELRKYVGYIRSIQLIYPNIIIYIRSSEEITSKYNSKDDNFVIKRMNNTWLEHANKIEKLIINPNKRMIPMRWLAFPNEGIDITIRTDASTKYGVGGYVHKSDNSATVPYFRIMWRDLKTYNSENKPDIIFEELLGVVLAASLYAKNWVNKTILFECDNKTAVYITRKRCSCFKRPDLNKLVFILFEIVLKFNFRLKINYLEGILNIISDDLSREKFKKYKYDIKFQGEPTNCIENAELLMEANDLHKTYHPLMGNNCNCKCPNALPCDCKMELFCDNQHEYCNQY